MSERSLEEVLARGRARRGYVLPYHRLLGTSDPDLLHLWQDVYEALILRQRVLNPQEKELVLLVMLDLIGARDGRIHVARAREAGLAEDQIHSAFAIAGAVAAYPSFAFGEEWADILDVAALRRRYLALFEAARADVPRPIAEVMALAGHAAGGSFDGMRLHLERAFPAGATVPQVLEALSYMIMTNSIPRLTEACRVWEQAAEDGLCPRPYETA